MQNMHDLLIDTVLIGIPRVNLIKGGGLTAISAKDPRMAPVPCFGDFLRVVGN